MPLIKNQFLKIKKIPTFFLALFIFSSLAIYFYFGFQHIGQFETADEHYWVYSPLEGRVHQYWQAIKSHNWAGTYINDKPGITIALISGPALLLEKTGQQIHEYERDVASETRNDPAVSSYIFSLYRIPIVIFNGIFSLFFLWALWKITKNQWIAFWGWLLILFSPVLIGISQIVNPDSLIWSFSTAVLLSYFLLLEKNERKYIFLTAFFFGCALLTKYTSLIFLPFFLVAGLAYYWLNFEKKGLDKKIRGLLINFLLITAGGILVFIFFAPGIFWQTARIIEVTDTFRSSQLIIISLLGFLTALALDAFFLQNRLISYVFENTQPASANLQRILYFIALILLILVIINWASSHGIFPKTYKVQHDLERGEQFRSFNIFQQIILELRLTVFTLAPLALFGWLLLLGKGAMGKLKHPAFILYLLLFVVAFYAAMLQQQLLITVRYGIIIYPVIAILAGFGIFEFFSRSIWCKYTVTSAIIISSVVSLQLAKPFYFNYSNFLLSNSQQLNDAWGYGGYEAAQYLNSLPKSENLKVWADYRGFCAFFKGICVKERKISGARDSEIDYFVKTRRGSIIFTHRWKNIKSNFINFSDGPVWQMIINNQPKNYIEIYKNKKD